MLKIKHDDNLLEVTANHRLELGDFDKLYPIVDGLIQKYGTINVLVNASNFSGWESFAAFKADFNFVKGHHQKVNRLAFVIGPFWLCAVALIAKIFLHPEFKVFKEDEVNKAKEWLKAK